MESENPEALNPRVFNFFALLFILVPFTSCNHSSSGAKVDFVARGRRLAHQYCATCHLFPSPKLLDRETWLRETLPEMGPRLGIRQSNGLTYPTEIGEPGVDPYYYPSIPIITQEDWNDILNYYYTLAPASPIPQDRPPLKIDSQDLFRAEEGFDPTLRSAHTTFLKIDPGNHRVYVGDALDHHLKVFNDRLRLMDSLGTPSAVTGVDFTPDLDKPGPRSGYIADVGILDPSELKQGVIQSFSQKTSGGFLPSSLILADSLHRPVQVLAADLNGDGRTDLVVADFGNLTGELYWLENLGNGHYRRHILRDEPGAIRVYVNDYNHDGKPDIWALFAQGREGIYLFTNLGHGKFKQTRLLAFPPVYGSSYFELDDFNHDGFPDILYTCGDNSDYSKILKAYHGVYIFLNDGHFHFHQAWFFPIDGCYRAMAADFRHNGKLDIAAISFFADYRHQPQESFVYLEDTGNLQFVPHTIPQFNLGHWITMDVGDLDGDGWPDIVLGNFSKGQMNMPYTNHWDRGPSFLLLKNEFRKKNPQKDRSTRLPDARLPKPR